MREGWHGLRSLRDPFGRGGAAAALAAARARARASAALAAPVGIALSPGPHDTGADRHRLEEEEQQQQGDREHPVPSAPVGSVNPVAAPLTQRRPRFPPPALSALLRRVLAWARRKRPEISGVLEWTLRLHLAAFYLNGRFASPAMRAVGARLAYARPEQEAPQTRYAVLGLLLLVQAAAEAASASVETAGRWRANAGAVLSERFSNRRAEAVDGAGGQARRAGLAEGESDAVRRVAFLVLLVWV